MLTAQNRQEIEALLGRISRTEPVAGGDINEARRVTLVDKSQVFVKSHASPPPGMYAAEAHGLAWLREGGLRVPQVLAVGDTFLALEWLELSQLTRTTDEQLGRGLAQLHALGAPRFGLERDNFLALLPQDNTATPDIATFYVERRLRPLVAQLRTTGDDEADLNARLDALLARPDTFGPIERPARLHGDLWWGNVGFSGGAPVLFDPAVYGGHREIDLAMLALFGGVSDILVGAYSEVWPLAPDWRSRIALWQLYPIAAHAVMFGGGYTRQFVRSLTELAS